VRAILLGSGWRQQLASSLIGLGLITEWMGAAKLRRWVQAERGGRLEMNPTKPLRSEAATELERVQRELRRVTMERDIPNKALGYFAKDPQ
jgi:transposase